MMEEAKNTTVTCTEEDDNAMLQKFYLNRIYFKMLYQSQGSQGKVYKYERKSDKTFVAVKKIQIQGDHHERKILNQIAAVIQINKKTDSVVKFYNYSTKISKKSECVTYYLVFELCSFTLAQFISKPQKQEILKMQKDAIDLEETKEIVIKELLKKYKDLTRSSFSHRDIKPANIMFQFNGELVFVDIGSIKYNISEDEESSSIVGTNLYLAPEIMKLMLLNQPEQINYSPIQSDIFSLGIVIYEVWRLKYPFKNNRLQMEKTIDKISSQGLNQPDMPSNLRNLIQSMIQKKDEDRISFQQLVVHPYAELEEILDMDFIFYASPNTSFEIIAENF